MKNAEPWFVPGETLSAPSEASAIPLARIVEQGTVHGGSVFSVTNRHFIFFITRRRIWTVAVVPGITNA